MQGSDHGGQASFAAQEQREPLLADELPLEADEVRPHRPILYASMGLCAFRCLLDAHTVLCRLGLVRGVALVLHAMNELTMRLPDASGHQFRPDCAGD